MTSTTSQRKQLYKLFGYSKETEAVHVRTITGDEQKTTAKDLTATEAGQLLRSLCTNWAVFDRKNFQHGRLLSTMHQLKWTKPHPRHGTVPDMARLSGFLKSHRSPVAKPLQNMTSAELTKLINCLESMLGKKYAKQ